MISGDHAERADVWRGQTRLDASSSHKDVSATLEVGREVDDGASVGGGFSRLKSRHFQAEVGES